MFSPEQLLQSAAAHAGVSLRSVTFRVPDRTDGELWVEDLRAAGLTSAECVCHPTGGWIVSVHFAHHGGRASN